MRYLLDTNALIELLRRRSSAISARIDFHYPDEIGVPVIALYELYVGAFRSGRLEESMLQMSRLRFPVVSFMPDDAREAAAIRTALEEMGTTIGPMDLLIAGQARARGLVLVTHNVREFSRVAGLVVEDWQAGL